MASLPDKELMNKLSCYFFKSNIPVINLTVDSRNMIRLSKNISLKKNR